MSNSNTDITVQGIGKRFRYEWIFNNIHLEIKENLALGVSGPNGSGKSTFLQILSGFLLPSKGTIHYQINQKNISIEEIYPHLVIAAPYQELIEEFTLSEMIRFHSRFKKLKNNLSNEEWMEKIQLEKVRNKQIKFFSSGMKQRVKLGLALYSDTPILLLDEPTVNLDQKGTEWYEKEIKENINDRLVVICSNQASEFEICHQVVDITAFK